MKPARFAYHAPTCIDDTLALLAEWGPQDGRILAGGQSLIPTMAFRVAKPAHLIDINGIAALETLQVEGDRLRIGACVRHARFHRPVAPGPTGRLLQQVVRHIAHYPIRTRGTFCGSVANADPASEWCCVMATLNGHAVTQSARGGRRIPAADFHLGIMTTALEEDELLAEVELPVLTEGTRVGFSEFSRRAGDFAVAMIAATYRTENGRIVEARIGVGGAEAVPRRIAEAEAALTDRPAGEAAFEEAARAAAQAIDPLDDFNNTAAFRRSLVQTLVLRALESAA